MQTPSPEWVRSLAPYVPGKPIEEVERELGIRGSIKLASNENPLGPSPLAMAAAREAVATAHLYPDAASWRLRDRLAARHGVPMERIVVANGSDELVSLLVRCFCTRDDNVVLGQYGFVAYRLRAAASGVAVRSIPMPDLRHDLAAMAAACDANTRLLFVANPNNPTGTANTRDEIAQLLRDTPAHVLVVLDEAYVEYAQPGAHPDGLGFLAERENLAVMRTFSKAYGLAAFRVGWGVVPPYVADLIHRVREPFNVNAIGQAAALAAVDDHAFLEQTVALNAVVRDELCAALDALGCPYVRGETNFVLLKPPMGGGALYEQLLQRGIITRPLGPYSLGDYLRISLGTREQNARLIVALREVLA